MSFVNHQSKEIHCKIVYFGPASAGKTTNLRYLYSHSNSGEQTKLVSLPKENEQTLFYDFLPLAAGSLYGYKLRFHLYTIPGQNHYDASRKLIWRGVDGIIFVSDSLVTRMEANLESLATLRESLEEHGYELEKLPVVYQYNKRDLPNVCPRDEMARVLNPSGAPEVESVAESGAGVFDTLKALSRLVLAELKGKA